MESSCWCVSTTETYEATMGSREAESRFVIFLLSVSGTSTVTGKHFVLYCVCMKSVWIIVPVFLMVPASWCLGFSCISLKLLWVVVKFGSLIGQNSYCEDVTLVSALCRGDLGLEGLTLSLSLSQTSSQARSKHSIFLWRSFLDHPTVSFFPPI